MSQWICIMRQRGEGCDYTIGCGVKVYAFEAKNEEQARKIAMTELGNEHFNGESDPSYYIDGEGALSEWSLYQVTTGFNMMPLLEEALTRYRSVEEKEVEAKELAELERLKKKFGK